jgi:hypothetical protein
MSITDIHRDKLEDCPLYSDEEDHSPTKIPRTQNEPSVSPCGINSLEFPLACSSQGSFSSDSPNQARETKIISSTPAESDLKSPHASEKRRRGRPRNEFGKGCPKTVHKQLTEIAKTLKESGEVVATKSNESDSISLFFQNQSFDMVQLYIFVDGSVFAQVDGRPIDSLPAINKDIPDIPLIVRTLKEHWTCSPLMTEKKNSLIN